MPRARQVTRTMKTTIVHALFANSVTRDVTEEDFVIPVPLKDEKNILKYVRKTAMFEGEKKLVNVMSFRTENTRYAMSEDDFIKYATKND